MNQQSVASRTIQKDWKYDKLQWDNGGDPLWLLFQVFDVNGMTALCAAYAFKKDTKFGSQSYNELAIANSRINLDGSALSNNLGFMNRVGVPSGKAPYGEAKCVLTERPWKAGYGDTIKPTYELTKSGNFVLYD